MPISAKEAAAKWKRNITASVNDIKAGVEAVTESPMEAAADAADKWYDRITEAHNAGRFASRLRAVSLDTWKRNTVDIGGPRIQAGAAKAESDMESFYGELFPYIATIRQALKTMPDVNLIDSEARMLYNMREMAKFHRS